MPPLRKEEGSGDTVIPLFVILQEFLQTTDSLNFFPFLYLGISLEADMLFLNISRKERNFKNRLRLTLSLYSLPVVSLPKSTGAKNVHISSNLATKMGKYMKTLSLEISVHMKNTTLPYLVWVLTFIDY